MTQWTTHSTRQYNSEQHTYPANDTAIVLRDTLRDPVIEAAPRKSVENEQPWVQRK